MKKCTLTTIKQGHTLFRVYAGGLTTFVQALYVTGRPFKEDGHWVVPCRINGEDREEYAHALGLCTKDGTVCRTSEEGNRSFFSSKKAESYRKQCVRA